MYFLKKNRYKTISKILFLAFVLEPVLLLGFFTPVRAQTNASNSGTFNQAFSSYDGISQWGNLDIINNPAIGSALRSCLQVVPSFTKKIKRVYGTGSSASNSGTIGSSTRSGSFNVCDVVNEDKWGYGSAMGDDGRFGGYLSQEAMLLCQEQQDEESGLTNKVDQAEAGGEAVPTEDKIAIKKLESITKDQKEILAKLAISNEEDKKTNKNLEEVKVREECMDSIAYSMTKTLLAGVTEGTVNLINEGNFGDPFFIKDTKKYFEDIDSLSLRQVFGGLVDSLDQTYAQFPFLRSTYRNLVEQNVPTPFRDRARFTLEQILSGQPYNPNTDPANMTNPLGQGSLVNAFKQDFSVGGWEGWLALTQAPQNNPIGFAILAQEELIKNQTAAKEQAKSELEQSGGFLSMRRCTLERVEATYNEDGSIKTPAYEKTRGIKISPSDSRCGDSEVTTPGAVLASRLNAVITSDVRQLELSDRFNESLNLIFTTAFNKLTTEGLSALSNKVYGSWAAQTRKQTFIERYNTSIASAGVNANNNQNYEIIYRRTSSSYSSADFDITNDLFDQKVGCNIVPGILTNEKNYLLELERSNNVRQSPLYKLMPAMAELDFCVPGPTTNWEDLADEKYADVVEGISTNGIGFSSVNTSSYDEVVKKQIDEIEKDAERRRLGYTATQTSVMAAGAYFAAVTYGISAAVAGVINGVIELIKRRDNNKTQDQINALNDASDLLQEAIPYAFEKEGYEWAILQLEYLKDDYIKYKEAVYDKFSDDNSIPVAKVARPFIQDLAIYGENLLSIQDSYNQEIKETKERLKELQSIHDSVKAIKDAAIVRAKDQGLPTESPAECRPAANQCPKPSAIGRYLITADPTGYSPMQANNSYAADPGKLATAYGSTSSSSPSPNTGYSGANQSSTASSSGISGYGINGYKFSDPSVKITNFVGVPTLGNSTYNISFNVETNQDTISVVLDSPLFNNASTQIYGTSQIVDPFVSSNAVGQKIKLTAYNPNAKKVEYSCSIKRSGISLICE